MAADSTELQAGWVLFAQEEPATGRLDFRRGCIPPSMLVDPAFRGKAVSIILHCILFVQQSRCGLSRLSRVLL